MAKDSKIEQLQRVANELVMILSELKNEHKVELSYDGHTLEEFKELIENDCSNIELIPKKNILWDASEWKATIWKNKVSLLEQIEILGLNKFRIKPTPKYIRPKVGFRGSVMCEVVSYGTREIVAVAGCGCVDNKGGIYSLKYARLLPFSAENPPPVGTRFKVDGQFYSHRFLKFDKKGDTIGIISESGVWFNYSEDCKDRFKWLDFEECN